MRVGPINGPSYREYVVRLSDLVYSIPIDFGLVASVPRDLARLVKDARHGRMRVELDLKRLDSFGEQVERTINRVTVGVMTASLVIGSSIVMTVPGGPSLFGIPVLTLCGLVGYLIALVNSLWIILSIWRSGRL